MASVLGMYVGQSESQLREALETADRVAPCVLWIDEIEKGLANGTGDSGVSRRLLGQFLYWLQESTSKVFLVATANDVTTLPPELLRKGRFDEMFFVDLPDRQDREEIVRMYFRKHLSHDIPPDLTEQVVTRTEGFSGSDLAAVVHDIAVHQLTDAAGALPTDLTVKNHFATVVPYSQTNSEDVAAIRAWGLSRCVPAGSPAMGGRRRARRAAGSSSSKAPGRYAACMRRARGIPAGARHTRSRGECVHGAQEMCDQPFVGVAAEAA